MARIQKIGEHSVQVEINKPRPCVQQKRFVQEHFLEGHQPLLELRQQLLLLRAPLVDATAPELSLLMPQEPEPIRGRHHFLPENIIELKANPFDVAFYIPPENGQHSFQFPGKQPELELAVDVLGNHLRIFADLKNHSFPITDDGHCVVSLPAQAPDQRTIAVRDIDDFEFYPGEFQNSALDNTERAPRELNQLYHFVPLRCTTEPL